MASPANEKRFRLEKRKLIEMFGENVSFPNVSGEQRVEVKGKTSKGNEYTLRCYLEHDLLHSMPVLVVCEPNRPLTDSNGQEMKASYDNHCSGSVDGRTAICHCRPDRWDHRMDLCLVFIKGFIWLEAYDDNTLPSLPEMAMSEEERKKIEKAFKNMRREVAEKFQDHINQLMFEMNCQNVQELIQMIIEWDNLHLGPM